MWAPVVNNVVAVAGLVAMLHTIGEATRANPHAPAGWTSGQVALLAGSATLGVVAQALVLVVPLRRIGFRYRPRLGLRRVGLGTAGPGRARPFPAGGLRQL